MHYVNSIMLYNLNTNPSPNVLEEKWKWQPPKKIQLKKDKKKKMHKVKT